MPKQKVSVIIPAYNAQNYILPCLTLLEKQTYQNMEIILINDGSADQTDAVVFRYLKANRLPVTYLKQENYGQAHARNRGMEYATGRYVVFIDVDDRIEEDYLERLCSTAETYDADIVNCGYRTIREDGTILSEVSVSPSGAVSDSGRIGVFAVWAKLFKRSFLSECGISFPEGSLYEDIPFSLEAKFRAGCVKSISYTGYSYIRHPGSTLTSGHVKIEKFPCDSLKKAIARTRASGCTGDTAFEFEVLYFFTGFLFLYCRKAPAKDLSAFCSYTVALLEEYFPDYRKNPYLRKQKEAELSGLYRTAVRIFTAAAYTHTLKPFVWLWTRI